MRIKFLSDDRIGLHSGYQWPEPGEWVRTKGDLVMCRNGIHVPAPGHESRWIDREAWEIETDGDEIVGKDKVVVRSA